MSENLRWLIIAIVALLVCLKIKKTIARMILIAILLVLVVFIWWSRTIA